MHLPIEQSVLLSSSQWTQYKKIREQLISSNISFKNFYVSVLDSPISIQPHNNDDLSSASSSSSNDSRYAVLKSVFHSRYPG